MVGEIRDLETAQIAFQAAQTGHLVLSTLHTNDAAAAVTRLVEMGVPAYVLASCLLAVLAQRLIRRRCVCAVGQTGEVNGCELCRFTGYRGRLGVYEVMRMTPRVRSVALARGSEDLLRRASTAAGMTDVPGRPAQGGAGHYHSRRVAPRGPAGRHRRAGRRGAGGRGSAGAVDGDGRVPAATDPRGRR